MEFLFTYMEFLFTLCGSPKSLGLTVASWSFVELPALLVAKV